MKRDLSHLLDAALPLLAAAVIAGAILVRPDGGVWPLALGVPAALVLFLRHRATTVTLVVSAALALALFAVDHSAGAIAAIAPAAALYSFALEHRRLHLIVATSVAVVAVVVADVFLAGGKVATLQTALHVVLIATPLLAAEALRNRRSYVKVLLERLELVERTREEEAQRRVEQERLRIARDVHDIVAHSLTTINVQAGVAAYLLERDPEHVKGALTTIQKASHDALDELRGLLGVLRDADGERAPLQPTPGLGEIAALVDQTRQSGVAVTLAIEGERAGRGAGRGAAGRVPHRAGVADQRAQARARAGRRHQP